MKASIFVVVLALIAIVSLVEAKPNDPRPQWFTQRLDHFSLHDTRTWQQRFYVNDSYWNPFAPGPIFFQFGGEGAIGPDYVTELQMVNYGKKWGALLVALEHRFYGQSQPFSSLSTDNLRYLSSEQALVDAAEFLDWFQKLYKAEGVPIISFGCSYPGNLAAWFKIKYPLSTLASVASSAPVQATKDFIQYLEVVEKSLDKFMGAQCHNAISQATLLINDLLTVNEGRTKLKDMFNMCSYMMSDADVSTFFSNVMGNWMGTVQYNDENGNPLDIKYLCNIMESAPLDPLGAYAKISNIFLKAQQQPCLVVSYADTIAQLANTSVDAHADVGDRQWTYQTCTEFGYFQTTDSPNQPFGSSVPLKYYLQMCIDLFNLPGPDVDATNRIYGGNTLFPDTSNILFVNGDIDPWHALSVTQNVSSSVKAILIDGTAHCANVLPSRANDPPALRAARQQTQAQIDEWLAAALKKYRTGS